MNDARGKVATSREMAWALASYVAVSCWWLWPLPLEAAVSLLYVVEVPFQHADVDLHVWSLSWVSRALVSQPWNVFDTNAFYPAPLTLAYSEHLLGLAPLFAPVYLVTSNPVLATNVVLLTMHVLAAVGMYCLARRFATAPAAWIAGAMFAFYPQRLDDLTNFYLLATGWVPFAIVFTERWLDRANTRDAVGVALSFGAVLLSSFYLAYGAVLAFGLYLALRVAIAWRRMDARRLRGLGVALCAASIPFVLSSVPYLQLRQLGAIPEYTAAGAQTLGLDGGVARAATWRFLVGYGVPLAAWPFAVWGLWPERRDHIWVSTCGLALLALGVVLSLGPNADLGPLPTGYVYAALQNGVPGFSSLRLSPRFLWIAQLGCTMLVGLGLSRAFAWIPRAPGVTAALIAVGFQLSSAELPEARLHRRPVGAETPEAYRWLAENGAGRPLLEVPPARGDVRARRMLSSHAHWLPLLQGYSAYPTPAFRYLRRFALGLPSAHALEGLTRSVDVGWILVHLDELDGRSDRWLGELPKGLEVAARFENDLVVRVLDTRVDDARARLFGGRVTLGGVPLEPVSARCAGRITLERPMTVRVEPRSPMRVMIGVTNESKEAWPGLAFASPHTVQLGACVGRPGEGCAPKTVPLLADVAPGETVRVPFLTRAPSLAGRYELRLELFQPSGARLSECGAPARVVPFSVGSRHQAP